MRKHDLTNKKTTTKTNTMTMTKVPSLTIYSVLAQVIHFFSKMLTIVFVPAVLFFLCFCLKDQRIHFWNWLWRGLLPVESIVVDNPLIEFLLERILPLRNCPNSRYSKYFRYSRVVKFGWNCKIGQNCEIWRKLWNLVNPDQFGLDESDS